MNKASVFIDTSAFVALYNRDDEFHRIAVSFLTRTGAEGAGFVTTNFVLDEVLTFIRARKGRDKAVEFFDFLLPTF